MSIDWNSLRKEFDLHGMFDRIFALPEQLLDAGKRYGKNEPKGLRRDYSHILLIGMGGSAIGGDIVAAALRRQSAIPIVVSRGYEIPSWCGADTLVVATSYSGETEETLSAASEAVERRATLVAITTGGKLGEIARSGKFPVIDVPKGYPPRTAIGYLTIPALLLLETVGIYTPDDNLLAATCKRLVADRTSWNLEGNEENSQPVQIAESLIGAFSVIYSGGGESEPVARRWAGQLAENGKTLTHTNSFPELNHNEIVGWDHPSELLGRFSLIFLDNEADHERVKRGMEATAGLLSRYPAAFIRVAIRGKNPLERIFSSIYLGDMISYYVSLGNGVDPTPVRRIDKLKSELAG